MRVLKNDKLADVIIGFRFFAGSREIEFKIDVNAKNLVKSVRVDRSGDRQRDSHAVNIPWKYLQLSKGQNEITLTLMKGRGPLGITQC